MFQNQFHVGPVHLQASCYCQVSKRQVHFSSCQLCWPSPVLYISRAVFSTNKKSLFSPESSQSIIMLVLILIWIITRFIVRRSKDAGRCEEGGNVVVKTIRLAASHIKRFIILSLQCSLAVPHLQSWFHSLLYLSFSFPPKSFTIESCLHSGYSDYQAHSWELSTS